MGVRQPCESCLSPKYSSMWSSLHLKCIMEEGLYGMLLHRSRVSMRTKTWWHVWLFMFYQRDESLVCSRTMPILVEFLLETGRVG